MKKFELVIFFLTLVNITFSQEISSLSIYNANGVTIVDVEKAVEATLEEWDTYSNETTIQMHLDLKSGLSFVGELGFHRLYYWYEVYLNTSGYRSYRWGTIWTYHIGGALEAKMNNLFFQGGLNIRYFADGSGTTPGIMGTGGYRIQLSEKLLLPVGLRLDVIFGSATPIAALLNIGIQYNL